jgi:branched-subunit amino acid aminotransferase/4-amino-4-deoxychorismate lyase
MTWVYLNGAFVTAEEARLPASDAGLLYGRGLFETFRARRGSVYLLERHLARLRAGACTLGIEPPEGLKQLPAVVRELAERCGLDDARMRLTLTAGAEDGRPSLLVQARPATDYPKEAYERGVRAAVAAARRNETSPLARIKSLNYLDNLLAREEGRRSGADEALLLNMRGLLAEASTANLFIVHDGELTTPPVSDGALPGITRGAVLELARGAGIAARESSLTLDALHQASEAFLTNAVAGVLPLVSVDGRKVGSGEPGEVTRRVRLLYETAAG